MTHLPRIYSTSFLTSPNKRSTCNTAFLHNSDFQPDVKKAMFDKGYYTVLENILKFYEKNNYNNF